MNLYSYSPRSFLALKHNAYHNGHQNKNKDIKKQKEAFLRYIISSVIPKLWSQIHSSSKANNHTYNLTGLDKWFISPSPKILIYTMRRQAAVRVKQ